ncbi:fibronectin-binding protein A N-terminus-domain-containing protein [Rhypophila decipiens]|uniref:Ribosome quality control complex subunit 2 n=1 Tax=Rhypophila decipiens TaxID=261697 RepID=A0AAN6YDH4_9PEZI|nr:fibronectin-binding protein A N-terminus-domain-containing protein [Rhypophila decipiens]
MKQRFSSLDVKVVAHELSEALVNLRVANVYDLNSKILLLKFAKPNIRHQLLVESGFRCHLTDFARTTAPAPSNFVARLRKYLKTRRVTAVSQIGTDRIIEFQFSDGAYRLYFEFFASGNIILTDSTLKILALLRNVSEGEGQEPQRVGLNYTLENRQNYGGVPPLTKERLRGALEATVKKQAADQAAGKKIKKKGQDELRRGLATTITELPPILVDHVFRLTSFDPAIKPSEILNDDALLDSLFGALDKARHILEQVTSEATTKGYIIAKTRPNASSENDTASAVDKTKDLLYEDFQPFLPKQFEDDPNCHILPFEGYNKTVDEFFSSLEGQRLESKLTEREAAAKRKLEAARRDQAKRIEGLQEAEMLNLRKAAAIEANVERVNEAMDAVNGLLKQGMDWLDINKLVEREQKLQNPVAQLIKLPMNLAESTITLLLGENEEEENDEELDFDYGTDDDVSDTEAESSQPKPASNKLEIDINLGLSPWNNAREYYEQKRTAADKAQKTVIQSTMALKNAEQKIAQDLKKGLKQEKPVLQPVRKAMWFEKFIWFVSSDGYLVLGGRDAQQNEILYKRHLRKGDVYVHADLHGASSVIIKNNPKTPDAPIPPSTLAQAGSLSVCCSSAWDSKAGMGAWWVNADQVSKTAPTGEFLQVGSFMVRGKRNLLPPALLMLGFGIVFRISEQSRAKHVRHRLYDVEKPEGSSEKAPPVSNHGSVDHDDSDGSGSEGEDDNNERQDRANPLQSDSKQEVPEGEEESSTPEPPSEQLANMDLDKPSTEEQAPQKADDEDEKAEKKYVLEDDDLDNQESEDEQHEEKKPAAATSSSTPISRSSTPAANKPSKAPPKRGQRGKAKKIAQKYKNQDEEDRALMESLIGVTAGRQKAEAEAAAKAAREAEIAAAQERRQRQQERQKQEIAEHEELRKVLLEDGVETLDENEGVMELSPLDSLVGIPLVGDEILEAIPVCAPWSALTKVKYKAKLQPGNTKKGKAVKEIFERWKIAAGKKGVLDENSSDVEKMWPREVELIKGLKVEEAYNCVPVGKVTVMMGGGGGSGGGSSGGSGKGGKAQRGQKKK